MTSLEVQVMTLLALAVGFAALWWGERARRLDAQRREAELPVVEPPPPRAVEVRLEQGATPQAAAFDEGRESYVNRCVAEGFSRSEAEADWDKMMDAQHGDAGTG